MPNAWKVQPMNRNCRICLHYSECDPVRRARFRNARRDEEWWAMPNRPLGAGWQIQHMFVFRRQAATQSTGRGTQNSHTAWKPMANDFLAGCAPLRAASTAASTCVGASRAWWRNALPGGGRAEHNAMTQVEQAMVHEGSTLAAIELRPTPVQSARWEPWIEGQEPAGA
jgi:hypothetical protein